MAAIETAGLGGLLKGYRVAAGLTQEELAARAGLSPRAISDLERGARHAPQATTLRLLSDALTLTEGQRTALEASVVRRRQPRAGASATGAAPSLGRSALPVSLTSLVGREREVAVAATLLRRDDVRLLTLTGPGGVGKTRLALRVAEEVACDYPAGVAFVSLAPISDAGLVATTIAGALGVRPGGGQSVEESVAAYLRDKRLLLVLDNFEQVVEASEFVAAVLRTCQGVSALVTSRVTMRVQGEQEFAVPPLALPDPTQRPDITALGQVAAVRLFVERARRVRPDFALTLENVPTVAALCARLDGLPLAIELAAARVKALPLASLLARLERASGATPPRASGGDTSLHLLAGGARDVPARQRTMRDTIGWSYDLLDAAEQRLFRRLAVFTGGCTLEGAAAVHGGARDEVARDDQDSVFDHLSSLVDKSLLRMDEDAAAGGARNGEDGPGGPRYIMLETVRAYAWERLQERVEAEEARTRHAAYYLALAEAAEPQVRGRAQPAWLDLLEREHDNLRVAMDWAWQEGDYALGVRVAAALWWFWFLTGQWREGRDWYERFLDPARVGRGDPARVYRAGVSGLRAG